MHLQFYEGIVFRIKITRKKSERRYAEIENKYADGDIHREKPLQVKNKIAFK